MITLLPFIPLKLLTMFTSVGSIWRGAIALLGKVDVRVYYVIGAIALLWLYGKNEAREARQACMAQQEAAINKERERQIVVAQKTLEATNKRLAESQLRNMNLELKVQEAINAAKAVQPKEEKPSEGNIPGQNTAKVVVRSNNVRTVYINRCLPSDVTNRLRRIKPQ